MDRSALYEEVILDHNRSPRNWGELPGATARAEGHNPLCGDQLTLWLALDGDVIREARFQGEGCAISKASASMMTEAVRGKTLAEVEALTGHVMAMLTQDGGTEDVGKLVVLEGVRDYPVRVKCATLAWHTLKAALKDEAAQVRCAMFRQRNLAVRVAPRDGLQVLLRARVGLYEARGEFQLVVDHLEEAGEGELRRRFEALKQKLAAEGLFDADRKRPLPRFPRRIGIVTSATGAALRDVLHVLARRAPGIGQRRSRRRVGAPRS